MTYTETAANTERYKAFERYVGALEEVLSDTDVTDRWRGNLAATLREVLNEITVPIVRNGTVSLSDSMLAGSGIVMLPLVGHEMRANNLVFDETVFRPRAVDIENMRRRQARDFTRAINGGMPEFEQVMASSIPGNIVSRYVATHTGRVLASERFGRPAQVLGSEMSFTMAPRTRMDGYQDVVSRPVILTAPTLQSFGRAIVSKTITHQAVHSADVRLTSEADSLLFPDIVVTELRALAASYVVVDEYSDGFASARDKLCAVDTLGALNLMENVVGNDLFGYDDVGLLNLTAMGFFAVNQFVE